VLIVVSNVGLMVAVFIRHADTRSVLGHLAHRPLSAVPTHHTPSFPVVLMNSFPIRETIHSDVVDNQLYYANLTRFN